MNAPPAIRRQTEREFQAAVVELAERLGWRCGHHSDSRRQVVRRNGARLLVGDRHARGLPDWLFVRTSRLIVAELKAERGRLSDDQKAWLHALANTTAGLVGHLEVYVWRPSDWHSGEIERALR